MKETGKYIALICILLVAINRLNAQQLILQSNKQMYVAGEEVGFKCTLINPGTYSNSILFVDICGEGYTVTSHFLKPSDGSWSSWISLPDTLQTGVYLLRTYVGNPDGIPIITTQPLCVLNRFMNNETNTIRKERPGYLPLDLRGIPQTANDHEIKLETKSRVVGINQKIEFELTGQLEENNGGISFSVFKAEPQSTLIPDINYSTYTESPQVRIYNYLVLGGKLTDQETGEPVTEETILLSIPDSIANINYAYTNEKGEFRFVLDNLYGPQDIIVQPIGKQNTYSIMLYPLLLLPPQKIPFYIPEEVEKSEFADLSVKRVTMQQAYAGTINAPERIQQTNIPFYGLTDNRVVPGRFVPLDDFAEIAWEILPTVRYKSSKDSTYLTIWNPNDKGFFQNPWTLVDGVPVKDLAQINQLNSDKISWIAIQPKTKCYGELLMKGLVAIQTKNGNFTDIPLPENAVRTTIETFYKNERPLELENTAFRDVLYWNSQIAIKAQKQPIKVKTSFEKGHYVAVAQTCNNEGKIYRSVVSFEVK